MGRKEREAFRMVYAADLKAAYRLHLNDGDTVVVPLHVVQSGLLGIHEGFRWSRQVPEH